MICPIKLCSSFRAAIFSDSKETLLFQHTLFPLIKATLKTNNIHHDSKDALPSVYLFYLISKVLYDNNKPHSIFEPETLNFNFLFCRFIEWTTEASSTDDLLASSEPGINFSFTTQKGKIGLSKKVLSICSEMMGLAEPALLRILSDQLKQMNIKVSDSFESIDLDFARNFVERIEKFPEDFPKLDQLFNRSIEKKSGFEDLKLWIQDHFLIFCTKKYSHERKRTIKRLLITLAALDKKKSGEAIELINSLLMRNPFFVSDQSEQEVIDVSSNFALSSILAENQHIFLSKSTNLSEKKSQIFNFFLPSNQALISQISNLEGICDISIVDDKLKGLKNIRLVRKINIPKGILTNELNSTETNTKNLKKIETKNSESVNFITLDLKTLFNSEDGYKFDRLKGYIKNPIRNLQLISSLIKTIRKQLLRSESKLVFIDNALELFAFSEKFKSHTDFSSLKREIFASKKLSHFSNQSDRILFHPFYVALLRLSITEKVTFVVKESASSLKLGFHYLFDYYQGSNSLCCFDNNFSNVFFSEFFTKLSFQKASNRIILKQGFCNHLEHEKHAINFFNFIGNNLPISLYSPKTDLMASNDKAEVLYFATLPILKPDDTYKAASVLFFNDYDIWISTFSFSSCPSALNINLKVLSDVFKFLKIDPKKFKFSQVQGVDQHFQIPTFELISNPLYLKHLPGENKFRISISEAQTENIEFRSAHSFFLEKKEEGYSFYSIEELFDGDDHCSVEKMIDLFEKLKISSLKKLETLESYPQIGNCKLRSARFRSQVRKLAAITDFTSESMKNCCSLASQHVKNFSNSPIVVLTPEYGNLVKRGGLAVMIEDLSKELAINGEEIIVMMPFFNNLSQCEVYQDRGVKQVDSFTISCRRKKYEIEVHYLEERGVKFYFFRNNSLWKEVYKSVD